MREMQDRINEIHPSIVKAICKVQAGLEGAIKRDGRNSHGGYQFASTDAVYAALTKRMSDAGLSIIALENEPPVTERVEGKDGKKQLWGKFSFGFILATEEATWHDAKSTRSLFIQITGPQTFMAAESYAMKAFLRSLFKLPTGDLDLDAVPQDKEVPIAEPRKSSSKAKKDGTDEKFNEMVATIRAAQNASDLMELHADHADQTRSWYEFPNKWASLLEDEFNDRFEDLKAKEGARL